MFGMTTLIFQHNLNSLGQLSCSFFKYSWRTFRAILWMSAAFCSIHSQDDPTCPSSKETNPWLIKLHCVLFYQAMFYCTDTVFMVIIMMKI